MTLELRDRPIFICGHPKSGTSLVRSILDSHPQLVVYPEETIFFRRYLPQSVGLDREGQLKLAEECLIHIFDWSRKSPTPSQEGFPDRDYTAISSNDVRQSMKKMVDSKYQHTGDILSAVVLAFGEVNNQINLETSYWVEKSPYNEYFAALIFTWWPEARCIHIVRDPRDNYASYRIKHPDWSAEFFSSNWRRSTLAGLRNQERFGVHRYHLFRYEDLVLSPETSIEKLADFLGIDWHLSLTAPTRAGEQWVGNSMFADEFQRISSVPIDRWKESLAPLDTTVIELMTRQLMKAFQYMPASTSQSFSRQVIGAHWRIATWSIRRRLTRLTNKGSGMSDQ